MRKAVMTRVGLLLASGVVMVAQPGGQPKSGR
jgi:hypothetical protein